MCIRDRGPSGVGKGTIVRRLLSKYPTVFGLSVSHTTRKPRPGEVDGRHYHFSSEHVMSEGLRDGLFAEHANVHGNLYGTSFVSIQDVAETGRVCLLDIDIQGLQLLREGQMQPVSVFVTAPSLKDLEDRLVGRETESPASLRTRLNNAREEVQWGTTPGHCDHVVVNDDFGVTPVREITQRMMDEWYLGTVIADKLSFAMRDEINPLGS
eukprot:TRINITY_DN11649_c0_g1_i2.p1 TRINITY_DN11649_c0_g1~~TRINITY_DN11649_c0_g1_i2.p1  ORF type:complete len:210 (-),score=44.81 TRINITY_DN11649_c0_g1_i2:403-1032(-)